MTTNQFFSVIEQGQYGNFHMIFNKENYEVNNMIPDTHLLLEPEAIKIMGQIKTNSSIYMADFIKVVNDLKLQAHDFDAANPKAIFIKGIPEEFIVYPGMFTNK